MHDSAGTTRHRKAAIHYIALNAQVQHDCDSTKGQSGAAMYDPAFGIRAVITAGSGTQNFATQVRMCVCFLSEISAGVRWHSY